MNGTNECSCIHLDIMLCLKNAERFSWLRHFSFANCKALVFLTAKHRRVLRPLDAPVRPIGRRFALHISRFRVFIHKHQTVSLF